MKQLMDWTVRENKLLQEKIFHTIVEPGLNLYVLPKKGYNKKYAIFSTRFGSIDNVFRVLGKDGEEKIVVPDGVAHFLEHKLFDDEEGNVFDRFAVYGASTNAFTSFTHTTYLFSCTDFFPENFELLLEFVQNPYFTDESVAKEQGIIQQEIRMYEDNPQWRVYFNLLSILYQHHPVRNDIAGTIESIGKITKEILYKCYETFYHPRNMAVFVTGDVSPEDVGAQVAGSLARRSHAPLYGIERIYPQEQAVVLEQKIVQELSVSLPLVNIGFKDPYNYLEGRELLYRELAAELLLEMIFSKSEPLYNSLYEDGLIDEKFSASYVGEVTYGYSLLGGETRDPDALHARIMEGIEEVRKKGLSRDAFFRHRSKMQGEFLRSFNSLEFIANNYLAYRFKGIDFFDIFNTLGEISLSSVEELLEEHFQEKLHAISIIKPVQR